MATRDDILGSLAARRADLARLGVRRLSLFGSVARGDDSPESDVDMLVAFAAPTTFDGYFDLKFWLEDLLHRPVDLVTERALRPELAAAIRREAVHVAP